MARAASETKSLPKPAKVVRSLSVDIGKQFCIFISCIVYGKTVSLNMFFFVLC